LGELSLGELSAGDLSAGELPLYHIFINTTGLEYWRTRRAIKACLLPNVSPILTNVFAITWSANFVKIAEKNGQNFEQLKHARRAFS
jgi:Na+/citrate or Na+/malate symporter